MTAYFFLFVAVSTAVSSQLLTKFQMQRAGTMPDDLKSQVLFLFTNLLSVPIILAITLTFISGVSWLGVLSKLNLSQAYPFMLLVFPLIVLASAKLFGEQISAMYLVGAALILLGLFVISR